MSGFAVLVSPGGGPTDPGKKFSFSRRYTTQVDLQLEGGGAAVKTRPQSVYVHGKKRFSGIPTLCGRTCFRCLCSSA